MLHRVSARQPRHILLGVSCFLLFLLCSFCASYYLLFAPNRDVPLLSGAVALLLLWPLGVLSLRIFGKQVIQIEHVGIVVSFHCLGLCLNRRGWTAAQVLHFDWDYSSDGGYALRLLLLRMDGSRAFTTVLHTDAAYAFAAVWRDLELHYPGSGLRTEFLPMEQESKGETNCVCLVVVLLGAAAVVWLYPQLSQPFKVAAYGRIASARVVAIDWGCTKTSGSSYYLRMLPDGADEPVRSASSFNSHSGRVPCIGQRVLILWCEASPCYLPGEVFSFLAPIPIFGLCIVMIWGGIWGLMHSAHRSR